MTQQTTSQLCLLANKIKQIQGWKLGKKVGHRVVVKAFSGATATDMNHYLKPTLEKNPQQILLHEGTNDLRDQNPNVIVDNVVELAREIESETNAQIILSELVTRSDVSNVSVQTVNKKLKKSVTKTTGNSSSTRISR